MVTSGDSYLKARLSVDLVCVAAHPVVGHDMDQS